MPFDDVQKFSNAAIAKSKLLKEHPGKYFIRSVMAGFFIAVAMIYCNVVGNCLNRTAWWPGGNSWERWASPLRFF